MIKKYIKKPVVVEAVQFDGTILMCQMLKRLTNNSSAWVKQLAKDNDNNHQLLLCEYGKPDYTIRFGDWIVKDGINLDALPDAFFRETYEEVKDAD